MAQLKIVARFRDGRTVKGTTYNFWPGTDVFHVAALGNSEAPPQRVAVGDLKALFIVRSLEGDPMRKAPSLFGPGQEVVGKKLQITFADGEVIQGSTLDYDTRAQGFFLRPANPNGNNERIYVVNAAVRDIRQL